MTQGELHLNKLPGLQMKWLEPDNLNGWKSMTAGWTANANACGNLLMGMIRKKGKNRNHNSQPHFFSRAMDPDSPEPGW